MLISLFSECEMKKEEVDWPDLKKNTPLHVGAQKGNRFAVIKVSILSLQLWRMRDGDDIAHFVVGLPCL